MYIKQTLINVVSKVIAWVKIQDNSANGSEADELEVLVRW